jgi:hypothetical protein
MRPCTETYRPSNYGEPKPPVTCLRQVSDTDGRHVGRHCGWEAMPLIKAGAHGTVLGRPQPDHDIEPWRRLWAWDKGGAAGSTRHDHDPTICGDCGVLFFPGHFDTKTRECNCGLAGQCWDCGEWAKRVASAESGHWRYLRAHDSDALYSFDARNPGGFGGRRYTITMDDGTVVAHDKAGLWFAGDVPWWLDEKFPANCTIESGSGTTKVPGYTDPFGQPLEYTGGPDPDRP